MGSVTGPKVRLGVDLGVDLTAGPIADAGTSDNDRSDPGFDSGAKAGPTVDDGAFDDDTSDPGFAATAVTVSSSAPEEKFLPAVVVSGINSGELSPPLLPPECNATDSFKSSATAAGTSDVGP